MSRKVFETVKDVGLRLRDLPAHALTTQALAALAPTPAGGGNTDPAVLVVRLDEIGDFVLTTPFFTALRGALPGHRIIAVANPLCAPLAALVPAVDEVMTFVPGRPGRWAEALPVLRQGRALHAATKLRRRHQFDLALVPRWGDDRYHATQLAALAGADRVVGFASSHLTPPALRTARHHLLDLAVEGGAGLHESERPLLLLRALGHEAPARPPRLDVPDDLLQEAREVWSSQGAALRVVVAPGAGHASRRWPAERFGHALAIIAEHRRIDALVVGAAGDAPLAEKVGPIARDLCGNLSLAQTAALLATADLVLANDSGPMHVACAVGTPTVGISCHPIGGDPEADRAPERFGPVGAPARVARPGRVEARCRAKCVDPAAHCILEVGVAEVVDAAWTLVTRSLRSLADGP